MTKSNLNLLLSPAQIARLHQKNHMVMAPLTRSKVDQRDVPTSTVVECYRQRAGAGLIITEGYQVSARGKGYMRTPGIFTSEQIAD